MPPSVVDTVVPFVVFVVTDVGEICRPRSNASTCQSLFFRFGSFLFFFLSLSLSLFPPPLSSLFFFFFFALAATAPRRGFYFVSFLCVRLLPRPGSVGGAGGPLLALFAPFRANRLATDRSRSAAIMKFRAKTEPFTNGRLFVLNGLHFFLLKKKNNKKTFLFHTQFLPVSTVFSLRVSVIRVVTGFHFEFYLVLPSFTGFYLVLLGFT